MKAAKGFTYGEGDGKPNTVYKPGDEVPDKVVKDLGDTADTLILEKAAKKNPDSLTREQLMELAGIDPDAIPEEGGEEFNEDEFREAMSEFKTKGDLVEWAEGVLEIEGLNAEDKRDEIEDQIVEAMTSDPDDES